MTASSKHHPSDHEKHGLDKHANYRQRLYDVYHSRFKRETRDTSDRQFQRYCSVMRRWLKGWLPEDRNARILDVGSGSGEFLRFLHTQGYGNCEGIELSQEQVEQSEQWTLKVHCGNALDFLKNCSEQYALITAFDFLEHLTRSEAFEFLSYAREVLRGGSLIMKVPNVAAPRGMHYFAGDLTHEQAYSPSSLLQILRATDFADVEFRETKPVPHSAFGAVRSVLWYFARGIYILEDRIETGGQLPVYTRNVIVRAVPVER